MGVPIIEGPLYKSRGTTFSLKNQFFWYNNSSGKINSLRRFCFLKMISGIISGIIFEAEELFSLQKYKTILKLQLHFLELRLFAH